MSSTQSPTSIQSQGSLHTLKAFTEHAVTRVRTFTFFPFLPTKLRLHIWELAANQQRTFLHQPSSSDMGYCPLLHISHFERYEACKQRVSHRCNQTRRPRQQAQTSEGFAGQHPGCIQDRHGVQFIRGNCSSRRSIPLCALEAGCGVDYRKHRGFVAASGTALWLNERIRGFYACVVEGQDSELELEAERHRAVRGWVSGEVGGSNYGPGTLMWDYIRRLAGRR